ncbi:MAG: ammonia-forming cytochrome c nitrite reductase [Spirochaetes bacterium]|nr:ammonia-forming cytochrome c nitrite reductase [Spirochaetota bacterium]
MFSLKKFLEQNPHRAWFIYGGVIIAVFLLGLFTSSIMQRRAEAVFAYKPAVKINAFEADSAVWGANFPREYESYLRTASTNFRSKYNGSAMRDMLADYPALVILWAGYPFSLDYNQGRGHQHAIDDIRTTLRTGAPMKPEDGPMPSTCWSCKSSDVPGEMRKAGSAAAFYKDSWASKGPRITHSIGCADCHDETTMSLKITRPALVEAFERRGKDIGKVTHQEMRSLVCAQCHVEYYFKGPEKYLTFPWDKGMSVEAIEAYYDGINFSDWKHKLSRTPMIKCQHPDYEVYLTGLHARRGVTCADCHMPYRSEGGQKFTDHHIQSPLNNIASTCQVCHRESEEELKRTVYTLQDAVVEQRVRLEALLAKAHIEAAFAWEKGADDGEMKEPLTHIRHAQWRWDYAAATHGGAFHSGVEMSRILSSGIEKAQEARLAVARVLSQRGFTGSVPMPDISTKDKAQRYLGIDNAALTAKKQQFISTVIPQWLAEAQKNAARNVK